MPINVIIENRGAPISEVRAAVDRIRDRLSRPDPTRAVKRLAEVWGVSYKQEGGLAGGWPSLADSTVEERLRQGFPAAPILRRSGSLYDMSIEFFMAGRPGASTRNSSYGGRTVPTTATLNINDGTATLGLSGPKVVHQLSKRSPPNRPYWFSERNSQTAARLGVIEWIEKEALEEWNR